MEVTFDIDGNGIVHVSAKDLGTGKEQSIKITASSGLEEGEIDRMIKDAEAHAEDDKKRREAVEEKNKLDGLIYSTEQSLKQHGETLSAEDKAEVERALADAKRVLNEDSDAAALKKAGDDLTQAAHKLAAQMYQSASADGAQAGANGAAQEQAAGESSEGADDSADASAAGAGSSEDVVDADFEEVQ